MGQTQRVTERIAAPFTGARVNREAGTIDDVLICGTVSQNGRDYPEAVLRRDHRVYEGKPVNCDHSRESTVDRRFGWFTNVRPGDDGRPRGRLNCLKSHPMFERVMEAAERNPALFGFSHVAHCETTRRNGRETVEAIREVESIDLVAQPATTKSLFESQGAAVTIKFRESLNRIRPAVEAADAARGKRLRKFLLEAEDDAGMGPLMDAPVEEPAADGDPDDALWAGFSAAIDAIKAKYAAGEMDAAAAIKAVAKYLKAHAKLASDDAPAEPDGDEGDDETPAEESAKRKPLDVDALVTEAAGFGLKEPTVPQLRFLAKVTDPEARRLYCVEAVARVREAETPRSSGKNPGAGPLPGKKDAPTTKTIESVPTSGAGFAAAVRS